MFKERAKITAAGSLAEYQIRTGPPAAHKRRARQDGLAFASERDVALAPVSFGMRRTTSACAANGRRL